MIRPRRTVLYVPLSNEKALAKLPGLDCDCVILDLEDSVAPAEKPAARERLRALPGRLKPEIIVRINPLDGEWGAEDLLAARAFKPDAILLPKVNGPRDVFDAADALSESDAGPELRLWAMIETPKAVLNISAIAEAGRAARLDCLVIGANDLAKDTGAALQPGRAFLIPWLMQILLAGRAAGLDVIDGVFNNFTDEAGFAAECAQGAAMGFDGKSLIHPAQIAAARAAFSPTPEALAEARALVAAFALAENAGKGVIALNGRMAERLHLKMAERLLAKTG